MTRVWIENNKIKIYTSELAIKFMLEVTRDEFGYIPWKRERGYVKVTHKIYEDKRLRADKDGNYTFTIGLGWLGYIASAIQPYVSMEDYQNLVLNAYSTTYRDIPFKELRDYQNEDVLFMLKYRRGVCSVYTSYGKTQTIATLANYAASLGQKVLIVAPGKKPLDELVKRCKTVFNLDIPNEDLSINALITSGVMNSKKVKDPVEAAEFTNLLASYDWVLVDEVEYCMNPGGFYIFDRCTNAKVMYAFSGTAEKKTAKMISFRNGLNDDSVLDNKDLIKYFGPSLIYRAPLKINIDNIYIKTKAFENIIFDEEKDFGEGQNVYMNVMNKIWTDEGVINVIEKVISKYHNTFIPINNLTYILNDWIENHFLHKYRILLVCGEGYIYYDLEGNRTNVSLEESCNLIKQNQTDVILSTSSGYRALDFPGLENILLIQGNIAGVILQCVGRVARGSHMNIISLIPSRRSVKLPIYSKSQKTREELIKEYYKYCQQTDSYIAEEEL